MPETNHASTKPVAKSRFPKPPHERDILSPQGLAEYLDVNLHTIRNWRFQKKGPAFYRVGGNCVRYRKIDVDEWLASKRIAL